MDSSKPDVVSESARQMQNLLEGVSPGDVERLVPELWGAGLSIEDAEFAARMLRQKDYYLVRPDDIQWEDIHRFQDELKKGQDVREDACGFMIRAIMALFGKKADPVKTYRAAARELLESVGKR